MAGEYIARSDGSVGTSWKALTTLFWNIGAWKRGENWTVPSFIDFKKFYKEDKPDIYPDYVPENNTLFLQMVKNLKVHLIGIVRQAH